MAVADINGADAVTEAGVNPGNTAFAGDASATGNVLTNDTDVDTGDSKTVAAVNGSAGNVGSAVAGTYGSVTIAGNGSYTYTLDNGDPDTHALAQGATASPRSFTYTVTDTNGATSLDHADHHHHRHQRRPGGGRRHQWRRCGHRGRRQSRQHGVRGRCQRDRQRADQRHRRRHRRQQDGFRGRWLGRQRRQRSDRHLRLGDDRRQRHLHLHARQRRSRHPRARPGRDVNDISSPTR